MGAPSASASPTGLERRLDRVVRWLIRGCEAVTALIGMWLMCILVIAVFYRYVLNNSISWVHESSSILLAWLMLAVAPVGFHQNFHIQVGVVIENVPRRARILLGLFINLCTVTFFAIAGYYGVINTMAELDADLFSVPLKRGYVTWVLPVFSLIVILVCVNNVLKMLRIGDLPERPKGVE